MIEKEEEVKVMEELGVVTAAFKDQCYYHLVPKAHGLRKAEARKEISQQPHRRCQLNCQKVVATLH